jgi:molecular chaperone DnaK (HSP70)
LIQFNKAFKGYKVGNDCDGSLDHVISNLKALILHPETEISAAQDGHATAHSPWVDGTTLKCFDQPTVLPNSAESSSTKLSSKTIPVEELVGFILSYLKDCAEDYLTRRPIKKTNVIDGSAVETTTHFTTPATPATTNDTTTATTSATPALRAEVHRVVLGVPVNCTERSKQCLKSAAQLAGFTEVRTLYVT